jgi:hypothetical protein
MRCRLLTRWADEPTTDSHVSVDMGIFRATVACSAPTLALVYEWTLCSRTLETIQYGKGSASSYSQACWEVSEFAEKLAREMRSLDRGLVYGM